MSALSDLRLVHLAVIGALVAALGLAACGRKGGLDSPPAPALVEPAAVAPDAPPVGPDGRPAITPPPPPRRGTLLDFLID